MNTQLLGVWACFDCRIIVELLTTGDDPEEEFQTMRSCGKVAVFVKQTELPYT